MAQGKILWPQIRHAFVVLRKEGLVVEGGLGATKVMVTLGSKDA
jgi:hypothetical protein